MSGRLPTVTQVLGLYADFGRVRPEVLAHAADRGSRVHAVCAAIAQGLWVPGVDEDCIGYVESFRKWWGLVERVLLVEEELVDLALGFCGHPDLVVVMAGGDQPALVDLKTPTTKNKLWAGQLAAYRHLFKVARGLEVGRVFSLRLHPKGNWPKADDYHEGPRDLAAFLSALNAYRWFNQP